MLFPSVLAPACNPNVQEAEANEPTQTQAQTGPHSETVPSKETTKVYSLMINELKKSK